jgi:acetyl esterase/lipase
MMRNILAMIALVLAAPIIAQPTEGELPPMPVWPKGPPVMKGWPGLAKVPVREEARDNGETLWNVTVPTLQPFLPDPARANGMAVVVAPGGGFRLLAINHEGTRVARWLAARGVAAFVLKYRLIQSPPGETNEAMRKRVQETLAPGVGGDPGVEDALEALRIVRANAQKWRINPQRVGIMGFSAGGHVAGMSMFAADPKDRPDFAGLIYGFPFGSANPPIPPANLPFPAGTPKEPWLQPKAVPAPGRLPPMFLAMAQDDLAVGVGFRNFYDHLFAAGYRPEVHLYERGSHGFGMATRDTTADHWIEQFGWWLDTEIKRK